MPRGKAKEGPSGRPAILENDPAVAETIVSLLAEGNYLETAAAVAGVSVSIARAWQRRGARDIRNGQESVYANFSAACEKAEGQADARDIRQIGQASATQWQASAWRLERRRPELWGKREHVEHSGGVKLVREFVGIKPEDV